MKISLRGASTPRGKKAELTCDCGCGTVFYRYRNKICSERVYVNRQHFGYAEMRKYLNEMCGRYLGVMCDYLDGAAKQIYSNLGQVRKLLCPFFLYLAESGINSLAEVTPATITSFQVWGRKNGYKSAAAHTYVLSVFFQWLIVEERYIGENPVIPSIHGKRNKARSGRPYSYEEVLQIRHLLMERGNERLRAFFELALESGMRNAEMSRISLKDLIIDTQTLRVGLPNKTMRERQAFFGDRASAAILEWLAVRKACGHQFLFHNRFGDPLRGGSILDEFKRALCKTCNGREVNVIGLDSFSIHRLRHTLTSNLVSNGADANTIMTVLGWVSPSSMEGYSRISEDARTRGFVTAMDKVDRHQAECSEKRVLTPEEFLLLAGEEAA